MDLFALQTQIEIDIQNAINSLNTLGSRINEVAKSIQEGIAQQTEANIDTSQGISELNRLNSTIQRQENELEDLKNQYRNVYLAQGETSDEAQQLARRIAALSNELQDNRNQLNNATNSANRFDNSLEDIDEAAQKTANGGFTVLKGAIANLISQGFTKLLQVGTELIKGAAQYQSSMEQYNTSFEVMTGSAQKAADVTKRLGEIAATTPFELTDLADTTQLLMNYGFTADDALTKMQMLGDISQGSAEKMNRIGMAYGQMSSAGKVTLEDVKQMIEAGFNPLQEISTSTGESMASLYNRISKGTISVDEITASMERSTAEGGKYFGSMDKQSQTLQGRLSTLKDTINASLGTALNGILETLANDILPKITEAMDAINWEDVGKKLGNVFQKIIDLATWIIDNFDLVATLIISVGTAFTTWKIVGIVTSAIKSIKAMVLAIKAATTAQQGLNAAMKANIIGLIISLIAALVAAFIYLWNNCEGFQNFWIGLWDGIKTATKAAIDFITAGFRAIWNGAKIVWNGIKTAIMTPINAAYNAVKGVVTKIKNLFNFKWSLPKLKAPKFSISPSGWKVGDLLKGSIPKLSVKWNAAGAVFNKPTILDSRNGLQGVGEAGAEAIAPIDTLQGYVQTAVRSETTELSYNIGRIYDILSALLPEIATGMDRNVVLNDGVLVGKLTPAINVELAKIQKANARGR